MEFIVTDHAYRRTKERCGWSKSTTDRMFRKVQEQGQLIGTVKGCLGSWLESKTFNCSGGGRDSKIYGDMLYVIDENRLVTVFHVPSKVRIQNKLFNRHINSFTKEDDFYE